MRIIAGSLGGRHLKTVEGQGYRPAMAKVRESLFSVIGSMGLILAESKVLDLFAGSGSLGFEALSRGASLACFVEQSKTATSCIKENAQHYGLTTDQVRVYEQDVTSFLQKRQDAFDLIFIDPPYLKSSPTNLRVGQKTSNTYSLINSVLKNIIRFNWLSPHGLVVAEVEAHLQLPKLDLPLFLHTNRTYGQTRILIWTNNT